MLLKSIIATNFKIQKFSKTNMVNTCQLIIAGNFVAIDLAFLELCNDRRGVGGSNRSP